jgi:hypothetical protein
MKKIFSLLCVIFGVALSAILIPSQSLAYEYSGYHWTSSTVYFRYSDLSTDMIYGLANAAGTWNTCGSQFRFYYDSSSSNYFSTFDYDTPAIIGMTYPTYQDGYNALMYSYFNTYYTWSLGGGNGTHDTQTVALHELGHWLTLNDIPQIRFWDSDKVMYGGYTGVKQTLNQDDINGIVDIYG